MYKTYRTHKAFIRLTDKRESPTFSLQQPEPSERSSCAPPGLTGRRHQIWAETPGRTHRKETPSPGSEAGPGAMFKGKPDRHSRAHPKPPAMDHREDPTRLDPPSAPFSQRSPSLCSVPNSLFLPALPRPEGGAQLSISGAQPITALCPPPRARSNQ